MSKGDNKRPSSIPYSELGRRLDQTFEDRDNRKYACPECGGRKLSSKLNRSTDQMERLCKSCKHTW